MTSNPSPEDELRAENVQWRARLEEAEETLRAIRSGEVDSLVVETEAGPQVFSLDAAEAASNRFRGEILAQVSESVIAVDREERITFFNAEAERQYAVRADDVLGRTLSEIYTREWPSPDAEATARNGLRGHGAWRGETVQRLHDGRELHVESSWTVLRGADGADAGMVEAVRDITARKQAEAVLRQSETRARLATEATAVGIWEWNVLTNVARWDAQMFLLYGITPTTDGIVLYSDWSGALLPGDLPEDERMLHDPVRRGGHSRREFRIRRCDDGEVRDIEAVETVRTNGEGQDEWVVGTNLDITDRKEQERQLRQAVADLAEADRRKDEFLATLAHELRNPLAPIRTGAALLRSTDDPVRIDGLVKVIERQVGHMVRLVDDLLDVGRMTTGKISLQRERVPVSSVVAAAVEAVLPLMQERGHALTVTVPPLPLVFDVDPVRVAQVISNILNNAAKFTDGRGRIGLTVAQHASEVVISVTDTGVGLATADLPRIFNLFVQVDSSRGYSHGGLGIGLALSKRLVEMHGGTIDATSAGAGQGSEFVVRLPLGSEVPIALVPSLAEGQSLSRTSRRILVVDDSRDGADLLTMMVREAGHDVCTSYDGETALEVAEAFRPETVLLDIGLPIMSGYDVCRHLRAQTWATGLIIIAMTGWSADHDRRRAEDAGFDHYLVKPVDLDAVLRMLTGAPSDAYERTVGASCAYNEPSPGTRERPWA